MRKNISYKSFPETQKNKIYDLVLRAVAMADVCGLRKTAQDIGISVNTLRRIITFQDVSFESWQKVLDWESKWFI